MPSKYQDQGLLLRHLQQPSAVRDLHAMFPE